MADTAPFTNDAMQTEAQFDGFTRADVSMVLSNPHMEDNPIVYVNEAFQRTTGYARSAVIGRNCRFLQGEDTQKTDVDLLHDAIDKDRNVAVDIVNYRANGEPFLNRLIVAPIHDADGKVQYFMGIQKEISSSAESGQAAVVSDQLIEVQNRVQTDMSMIIGMIRDQTRSSSAPEEFAALARRVETLQILYEEMKLADRQSNVDSIHMGSFLSRVTSAITHTEGRSGIRVNIQVEALEASAEVATRVGLVLSELLSNAFQHAFDRLDDGFVEVRLTRLSGGGLRLSISDDGLGIPADAEWPSKTTRGGRIVGGLIEGLEGTLQLNRGAAGSVIVIDVPAGANIS